MVYIYKKIIGNKLYYYLRASTRKRNKVIVKDIAYLGNTIEEVKKTLDKLPRYSEQIRKTYKTLKHFVDSNRYLEKVSALKLKKDSYLLNKLPEIEACKLHYIEEFIKKEEPTKQDIFKNFIVEFAFNTASIEGNTINLQEAKNLLYEGLTPKNKTLREIYDLQNTEKVFFEILRSKEELDHNYIVNIHKSLMENIDLRIGYRISDVRVVHAVFKSTPAPYVKTDMNLLLRWYNQQEKKLHPIVLATLFHHKFEKIHPFMDENGRTGRMLLNYILLKHNYPPLIIHKKKRQEYLTALRKADESKPLETSKEAYKKLINFITEEMTETYWNIFL